MFADIEGYTSLFQRSETVAMRQVGDHRQDLEESTTKYHGQIIQFYGDGSATVFDSVIDAIQCAIELQNKSQHHRIPIRIGIHMGDLVIKGGDIYGDVVNISSRIQNLGLSGSVLVSGKVVEELHNHPEIQVTSLGHHTLKNVKTRLEIFAVTGHGLIVPGVEQIGTTRSKARFIPWVLLFVVFATAGIYWWQNKLKINSADFEKGCLIIPPFTDRTTMPELSYIGELAASYLSKMMNGTSEVNVLSFESLNQYNNTDLASFATNPVLARRIGADYLLQGNYAIKGPGTDSLRFWASILDLHNMQTLPFSIPDVFCATNNPSAGIEQMLDILKGYYKSQKFNFLHVPNNQALIAYNQAVKVWADPKAEVDPKYYLIKAINLDPQFLDAYMLLLDGLNNNKDYDHELDTIQLIKSRFPDMNERETNNLLYYEADLHGKNLDAFNYLIKELHRRPNDLLTNTSCMVMAIEYLNDPATALKLNQEINLDTLDLNACIYCHTRLNMAMVALMNSGQLDSAGKVAERLKPYVEKRTQISRLISYYILVRDTSSIQALIRKGIENRPASWTPEEAEARYEILTARLCAAHGDTTLTRHYAAKAIHYYGDQSNESLARCLMVVNELMKAKKIFLMEIKKHPENKWLYADLGVVYARMGNEDAANNMISKLEQMRHDYDYGDISYAQARIKANLGATTEALQLLKNAFEDGIKFQPANTFQEDPELSILNSNPEYQAMLVQYRQPQ